MKWFKRKYKKSEWFEGLLECERLFQDGFVPDYNDFTTDRIGLMKIGSYVSIPKTSSGCYQGYCDYINYFHEKLK